MSSTETNNQSESPKAPQSGPSLAQRHSAVSPLIRSIASDGVELNPDSGQADQGAAARQVAQQQEEPQQDDFQRDELLSLSEQYGPMGLLAELDSLIETQKFQLEQHRAYVLRSRSELRQQVDNWKTRCVALDEQLTAARDRAAALEQKHLASQSKVLPLEARLDAAQQQTERLQAEVLDRRQQQVTLEEQLTLAETTLREQQEITAAQARSIVSMQAELSEAQAAVAILETRLSRQDHLRQQLKADINRDRKGRSEARSRQLQLEQETTQMTGQLLRLNEELRQAQRESAQWRRQAQTQAEQLRDIGHWASTAESVPSKLMALLAPFLQGLENKTELDNNQNKVGQGEISQDDAVERNASQGGDGRLESRSHSHLPTQSDSVTDANNLGTPADSKSFPPKLSLVTEPVPEKSLAAEDSALLSSLQLSGSNEEESSDEEPHASALNLPSFPQDAV